MQLLELPHLTSGSPTEVVVPGIPQVSVRDLLEAQCPIKACREFVSERLIVDKAICVRRADGPVVKTRGFALATFDARYFRTDQCGAVLEILRAMLSPDSQLPVVSTQCFDMLH